MDYQKLREQQQNEQIEYLKKEIEFLREASKRNNEIISALLDLICKQRK